MTLAQTIHDIVTDSDRPLGCHTIVTPDGNTYGILDPMPISQPPSYYLVDNDGKIVHMPADTEIDSVQYTVDELGGIYY